MNDIRKMMNLVKEGVRSTSGKEAMDDIDAIIRHGPGNPPETNVDYMDLDFYNKNKSKPTRERYRTFDNKEIKKIEKAVGNLGNVDTSSSRLSSRVQVSNVNKKDLKKLDSIMKKFGLEQV